MRIHRFLLALGLLTLGAAADSTECLHCNKQLMPQPLKLIPGRKYARDRRADILHVKLDVTPNFAKRTVSGTATLRFKPIALPLEKLELDAVDLNVHAITATGAQVAEHQITENKLILTFAKPIAPDAEASVSITYDAMPNHGLYFRTPEMGYKKEDTQVWSQGEAEEHRFWFPSHDYPNERFTSEVICHVPKGMQVISNGTLQSEKDEGEGEGRVVFHWLQDKPHVNYLIALAAGYFYKLEDKAGTLPLALLVPPSYKDQAANAFTDTRKIIEFYQKETGVPFAWDKYYQVYCLDFIAGGMENTSCTFEAADLLFNSDTEQLRSLHELDAHETAHQWFGDLVTCRDWAHLWLNEGFASYYTILYEEQKLGADAMKYALWKEAQQVFQANDTRPIVWRDYDDPMQQFDSRAYPKGAWVLHMLRSQLGPDLYRKCITKYLERHRSSIVRTEDLQDVVEEVSGLSFDQFFDQWLFHGGVPELKVDYSWDAGTKLAKITVRQTQKLSEQVRLFRVPLPVGFAVAGQKELLRFKADVSKEVEDFYFPLPSQPELVRIDPDYTVLAKISFSPPGPLLDRMLQSDVIGRLLAIGMLDERNIDKLGKALREDAFHAVRAEAARALAKISVPEARTALIAGSSNQTDARARKAVAQALAALNTPESQSALWKMAQSEKNPDILASIITSWGAQPADKLVGEALRKELHGSSYHHTLELAAIRALRAQDDESAVADVLAKLQTLNDLRGWDVGSAFDAIAFLARRPTNPKRDDVRVFLSSKLSDPRSSWRVGAAKALGTLRDPKALAVLEPLTRGGDDDSIDPLREAAAKSVQDIRASLESPADLKKLWDRVQQLQKQAEEQQKEIETLQKKGQAAAPVKKAGK
ncbi:M1 family aminopeptidase [Prosthecobacter vanneervenii]|uniref:Aminopeptidase N n=1 Tax=Prosthecobacter vanneervenii TaxID=48466 RepID=A0A7W7Y9W4_9BACT|nr:M1 family aminopeptidase [Prosthecobacter vanneervenii]MBB5032302.1 aminopeptidase N [Prosthecobacter vanneervenii]